MSQQLNILIVDDHHMIIEGYKSILALNQSYEMVITAANNCEEAYQQITKFPSKFDLIFLDWILPAYEAESISNGGDLALIIKKCSPNVKTIILTSHADAFTLYDIVKKINPSGLLVKSDFRAEDFLTVINLVLNGETYYSSTVKQGIKEINSRNTYLDNYNRQIITLLSKGIKTKNLPQYLPLSVSAIDKRKAQIKDYFLIEKGSDEDIIREAKRFGLI